MMSVKALDAQRTCGTRGREGTEGTVESLSFCTATFLYGDLKQSGSFHRIHVLVPCAENAKDDAILNESIDTCRCSCMRRFPLIASYQSSSHWLQST